VDGRDKPGKGDWRKTKKFCPLFSRSRGLIAKARRSEAEDFDRDDRDRLIAEDALLGLDLAGDHRVLDHRRQPEILHAGRRHRGERGFDGVDQRVEDRRGRQMRVARMGIEIELDGEALNRTGFPGGRFV